MLVHGENNIFLQLLYWRIHLLLQSRKRCNKCIQRDNRWADSREDIFFLGVEGAIVKQSSISLWKRINSIKPYAPFAGANSRTNLGDGDDEGKKKQRSEKEKNWREKFYRGNPSL